MELLKNINKVLKILKSNKNTNDLDNLIKTIVTEIKEQNDLLSVEDLKQFQESFNKDKKSNELLELLEQIKMILEKDEKRKNFDYHLSKQINYSEVSYTLRYLVNEFSDQNIEMPKYQRSYVWDKKQVSELILSLLRGIPIPKLYGYHTYNEEKNRNIKLIIDGQQRITSILMWYYGIFPKFKVRSINYSENMSTIVNLCNYYYDPATYVREANRLKDSERDEMLKEIDEAKNLLEKKYKLNLDVEFKTDIINDNGASERIDLSFRNKSSILTPQEKQDVLDTELGFVIVKGKESTETVDIFRLYNSSGTPLSPQEIRNGIYYRNDLYKKINQFNDETGRIPGSNKIKNKSWNNIRPRKEEKNDVKQLFSLLSFAHSYKNNKERFISDKREVLIDEYSSYISQNANKEKLINEEFESIKNFFSMTFECTSKNIKAYTALFIILKQHGFLNKQTDYKRIKFTSDILSLKDKSKKNSYLSEEFLEKIMKKLITRGVIDGIS